MGERCSDCPPDGYPTDKTRCGDCPRRKPVRIGTIGHVDSGKTTLTAILRLLQEPRHD
jgi:translation initiation factor 2 gamma subunit (eIF-2gamma)